MILMMETSPPANATREHLLACNYRDISTAHGDDGAVITANFRDALKHWFNRSEWTHETALDDDFELAPVPLPIVGTMKVRYVDGGKLRPIPYPVDDE